MKGGEGRAVVDKKRLSLALLFLFIVNIILIWLLTGDSGLLVLMG